MKELYKVSDNSISYVAFSMLISMNHNLFIHFFVL